MIQNERAPRLRPPSRHFEPLPGRTAYPFSARM